MKNLKKLFAVVLVVAMAFSLAAVASAENPATKFSDGADVKNVAAVDLLTGIGIIEGNEGAFNPTGTLTREQAAKIVAYLINGTGAANLKAASAPFSDVAKDRWSAGYIAFCVEEGIVAGTGDGTFNPEGKLTGVAWAKMLLCALGYDATAEGFVGENWAVNIVKVVNKVGLTLGLNIDLSAEISRDDACALAYKALEATMVEYPSTGTTITIGDTTVQTGAGKAEPMTKAAGGYVSSTPDTNDGFMQLCELYYPDLQKKVTTNFGRNSYKWVSASTKKEYTDFYGLDITLATSYNGAKITELTDPTSLYFKALPGDTVAYFLNGVTSNPNDCNAAADNKGVGVELLDVYPFDGKVDRVLVTNMQVATLPANPVTTSTTGTVTTVSVANTDITGKNAAFVTGYEGLAKGDVVMYYTLRNENGFDYYYIEKCASVTGTMSAYNPTFQQMTINGTPYSDSALGSFTYSADLLGVADVTYYLDKGNNIVKHELSTETISLSNYVFIGAADNTGGTLTEKYEAVATFMDGSSAIITVYKTAAPTGTFSTVTGIAAGAVPEFDSAAYTAAATAADKAAIFDKGDLASHAFYSFTKNDNGTYNLRLVANQAAVEGATETLRQADFLPGGGNGIATANTVFVYQNAQNTFNTYTGVANAPVYKVTAADPAGVYVLLDNLTGTYATAVVGLGGSGSGIAGDMKQVFVTGFGTEHYATPANYWTYPAIVDGVKDQTIESTIPLTYGTHYFVTEYTGGRISDVITSSDGDWDDLADLDATVAIMDYNAGTLLVGTTPYTLTADAKIFVFNTNVIPATVTEISADSIEGYAAQINGNETVVAVTKNGTADPRIAYVYLTLQTTPTANLTAVALTAPDDAIAGNDIDVDHDDKTIDVDVVNTTDSVVLTVTKDDAQTLSEVAAEVTITGGNVITIDTDAIAAAGGTYTFTLTVSQDNYASITYTITVVVAEPEP